MKVYETSCGELSHADYVSLYTDGLTESEMEEERAAERAEYAAVSGQYRAGDGSVIYETSCGELSHETYRALYTDEPEPEPEPAWRAGGGEELLEAVRRGDSETALELLVDGADPDAFRGQYGETALHLAAVGRDCRLVESLLAAGADPQIADDDGLAALHYAAVGGNRDILEAILMEIPAQCLDKADHFGSSPVFHAVDHDNAEALTLLVGHGARIDGTSAGAPLLHHAASSGAADSIKLLVEAGTDPNALDGDGHTPLHVANIEGVEALLLAGADPSVKSSRGETAADSARKMAGEYPGMEGMYKDCAALIENYAGAKLAEDERAAFEKQAPAAETRAAGRRI